MIKGWGTNTRGQLAAAFYGPPEDPLSCVALPDNVVQVAGAYLGYTLALLSDGTMLACGGGVNGEMGQGGHRGTYCLPVVPRVKDVQAFACAGAHIVALRRDGRVTCWGGNSFGTLGNGTSGHGNEEAGSAMPISVPGLANVTQVATGNGIVVALLADGSVRAWGCGATGALGIGKVVPLSWLEGTTPTVVPGLSNVKAVAAGGFQQSNHVLALLGDGTVVQWGAKGPCGTERDVLAPTVVPHVSSIVAVAAGPGQSFALDAAGDLLAWGSNTYGQLFLPTTITRQAIPTKVLANVSAVSAGFQFSLALIAGTVVAAGRNDSKQLAGAGLERVETIYAGEHHCFATGGEGVDPPLRATKTPDGLEVMWSSPATTHKWEVTPGTLGGIKGKQQLLPPSTRSVKIPCEHGVTMTVKVRGGATWPSRTAVIAI